MGHVTNHASFVLGCGIAHPPTFYSQSDVAKLFGLTEKGERFFSHPHIKTRPLALEDLPTAAESSAQMRVRALQITIQLAAQALSKACEQAQCELSTIDCLVAVTSTSFSTPGLSARLAQELQLKTELQRLDVVGMGCNAGLNAQAMLASWCQNHPGKIGALVCSEACSAIYDTDASEQTALANSLFADGAAALIMGAERAPQRSALQTFSYASYLIPGTLAELRFDWSEHSARYRFVIEKRVPALLQEGLAAPLERLLQQHGLSVADIDHWVVHAGGEAMLMAVERASNCAPGALALARETLANFGNLSSASYLFSYEQLLRRGSLKPGDLVLLLTMGPGLSVELALGRWAQ